MGSFYNAPKVFNMLSDWLAEGGIRPFVAILLFWVAFWPGWMFWVTLLVERRPVHLGAGQSKTFMPGDFTLGCIFVALMALGSRLGIIYTGIYLLITAFVAVIFANVARWVDIKLEGYRDSRSTTSPSKLVHDYLGFGCCGWLIMSPAIKVLWHTFSQPETFMENLDLWGALLLACAMFALFIVHDIKKRPNPNIMHPADWTEKKREHPWRDQWREICDVVDAIITFQK